MAPFGLQANAALVLLVLGLSLAVLPFCDRSDTRVRTVVFGACAFLGLRYIVWRLTQTVPPLSLSVDAICAWLYVTLETATIVSSTIGCLVLSRTKNRSAEVEANLGWWKGGETPLVDVLIATYNEEEAILTRTIVGALGLDHPALRVWVLDDGKRDWLRDLCARRGCHYLRRPDNSHAKAGNINHALKTLATLERQPDFVMVLDADFVAHSNFIERTLALFHDPSVGLVQTPQHFFNPDPIQANLCISRSYPDEQRFFFDHLMASRDAWGIAFCCGTSSIMRWEGLKAIGGFPTDSVTEDFLVSVKLKEQGWRTVYLNERLSDGLAPEGMKEYVTQRGRWCLGLVQIVRGSMGPFSRSSLSFMDRLGLFDSFFYWSATFAFRFTCFLVPILYWWFGVSVVSATGAGVVSYFLPYLAMLLIAMNWISRGLSIPLLADVSQMLGMFEIIRGVLMGLLKPKGQKFKVTAKGGQRDRVTIQWSMIRRFGILAVLTFGGILYSMIDDYAVASGRDNGIVLFWSFYNLVTLLLAMIVCVELPRYRQDERFPTDEQVGIREDGQGKEGIRRMRVMDISAGGMLVRGRLEAEPGEGRPATVIAHVEDIGPVPATVVRWNGETFALKFDTDEVLRDRLIRKLHSSRYSAGVPKISFGGIARGLGLRAMR